MIKCKIALELFLYWKFAQNLSLQSEQFDCLRFCALKNVVLHKIYTLCTLINQSSKAYKRLTVEHFHIQEKYVYEMQVPTHSQTIICENFDANLDSNSNSGNTYKVGQLIICPHMHPFKTNIYRFCANFVHINWVKHIQFRSNNLQFPNQHLYITKYGCFSHLETKNKVLPLIEGK